MVNPIDNSLPIQKVTTRDNKLSTSGNSGDKRDSTVSEAVSVSLSANEQASVQDSQDSTILNITSANKEASGFNLEDKETAEKVLQQTIAMMRKIPDTAALSQKNISSQILLDLIQAK